MSVSKTARFTVRPANLAEASGAVRRFVDRITADEPGTRLYATFTSGDAAAVVRSASVASGTPVDVYGHSFGGLCAIGAAVLGAEMRRLIVYEAPTSNDRAALPERLAAQLEERLAAGDRDGVVDAFLRHVVPLSEEAIDAFRGIPGWWERRTALAHTIVREFVADLDWPPTAWATVRVPTLFLVGGESGEAVRAEAQRMAALLPDARIAMLPGQAHLDDVMAPELVAEHILAVLRS